jgi:hypothetical protein
MPRCTSQVLALSAIAAVVPRHGGNRRIYRPGFENEEAGCKRQRLTRLPIAAEGIVGDVARNKADYFDAAARPLAILWFWYPEI